VENILRQGIVGPAIRLSCIVDLQGAPVPSLKWHFSTSFRFLQWFFPPPRRLCFCFVWLDVCLVVCLFVSRIT